MNEEDRDSHLILDGDMYFCVLEVCCAGDAVVANVGEERRKKKRKLNER